EEPMKLLEFRPVGKAEIGCRFAAPLTPQLLAVEIVAPIGLAEILGRLPRVLDRIHEQHGIVPTGTSTASEPYAVNPLNQVVKVSYLDSLCNAEAKLNCSIV